MSKVIFRAYAAKQDDSDSGIEVSLVLPATPYEMLDALDQIQLGEDGINKFYVGGYDRFLCLSPFLSEPNDLRELNVLAQKLLELDDRQAAAFEGLLEMELREKESLELPNLIDLAYNTDRCHVVDEVLNDSQLGRFLVENDFLPELVDLPDEILGLLDYERIGREHRQAAGGILVGRTEDHPGGYVERHDQLEEIYKTLDLSLEEPKYSFLLRISRGYYAPPASDCEKAVELELPASQETLEAVLTSLKVNRWQETAWYGLDCRVPLLTDMVYDIGVEESFDEAWMNRLNNLARRLADMERKTLTACKALLSVKDCQSLSQAETLIDTLDQYILSPQHTSPIELAKADLAVILCDPEREVLEPYVNLYQYGEALRRNCGGVLTNYGLIERADQQPVQSRERPSQQGGMEMR